MHYLLSVYIDESATPPAPDVLEKMYKDVDVFNNEVKDAGAWVYAGGLQPTSTATTVRPTDGEVTVTDGPYAETKEVLGGFWVVKADDLDAALDWAKRGSLACAGTVEVRPFQDDAED